MNKNKFRPIQEYIGRVNLPTRKTEGSAGYDIKAARTMIVEPGQVAFVPTGLKCYVKEDEYLALYMRSSIATKNKVFLIHGTGIIDSDYADNPQNEGHIMIPIVNMGDKPYLVVYGDRIVQGIFTKYDVTENDDEDFKAKRTGGFGSTGRS